MCSTFGAAGAADAADAAMAKLAAIAVVNNVFNNCAVMVVHDLRWGVMAGPDDLPR
jgi:hypothetical protein